MITVDYDIPGKTELDNLFFVLRLNWICGDKKCFIGRTHKGIHVYITGFHGNDLGLRSYLMDDPARIWFDTIREKIGVPHWRNTLFAVKDNGDYYSVEEPLSLKDLMYNILFTDDSFMREIHKRKTRRLMGDD